jgi:hypothetical protein
MARKVPRPFKYFWGSGQIVEEVTVAGEHHEPAIQLLRYDDEEHQGLEQVRFCFYNERGAFQRHPLVVSEREILGLREKLAEAPRLREMLKLLAG